MQPKRPKKRRKIQPVAIPRHKHSASRTGQPFIREKKNQAVGCAFLFCPFSFWEIISKFSCASPYTISSCNNYRYFLSLSRNSSLS
jgi:hypothetical protein